MLRAVSALCKESQALEVLSAARRDAYKVFRNTAYSTSAPAGQTVLTKEASSTPPPRSPPPHSAPTPPPGAPPPRDQPPNKRPWALAAAVAATAGIGGVYMYKKMNHEMIKELPLPALPKPKDPSPVPYPSKASDFPPHVQYFIAGSGTAAFAAMRAIRSARPDASVLLAGQEHVLPYMRPPLSKELWREKDLAEKAEKPDSITFRQWNGKRRNLIYEPNAFYTPVESLASSPLGGASVSRGWRVARVDVAAHAATLRHGADEVVVKYDKCLLATGVEPRRSPALRPATVAGKSFTVRSIHDVANLAKEVDSPRVKSIVLVGGGFLACELSAALADRTRDTGKEIYQIFKEPSCMSPVLPQYLCEDAADRLRESGVTLLPNTEITSSSVDKQGTVHLTLSSLEPGEAPGSLDPREAPGSLDPREAPGSLQAHVVVECLGVELDRELAEASELEIHPTLGGFVVNTELQARTDVFAAGDAACYHDALLGRRRVAHHDHAVLSGRLAGENMAGGARSYRHHSMFWSDLGPALGYEAVGLIDSSLPTVGVFSADAVPQRARRRAAARAGSEGRETQMISKPVEDASYELTASAESTAVTSQPAADVTSQPAADVTSQPAADVTSRRYERGVVFYLRERRVVGVLLWNLFNRMHVARQVLAQGEFDDLFEVAKLFSPHEED